MHTSIASNSVLTIEADGTRLYYRRGKLHRTDGPAFEKTDGSKMWWLNGKRHREDGPSSIWSDGSREWCLNGDLYTMNSYMEKIGLTEEEKVLFKLKWGGK
jgi:hypothetical protein